MRIGRRAGACLLAAALCFGLLSGCGQSAASGGDGEGLSLSVCVGGAPSTLDPIYATASGDVTVLNHLYENLMKIAADNSGGTSVVNGLAKSYHTDENKDGTVTYSFRLRNAKWSDGTAVTAQDFVYAWRRLANPVCGSPNASLLSIVKGYDEVQSTGDTTALAVEAKNDQTFVVTLTSVCDWFLTDVCTAPAAAPLREDVVQRLKADAETANQESAAAGETGRVSWWSDYTKLVTSGGYTVQSYNSDSLTLRKSGETGGPDTLTFRYADSPEAAWNLYEAGTVDFVSPLPESQLTELAKNPNWTPKTELSTCTLLFNTGSDEFNDPAVRQAFSLALDRNTLSAAAGVENTPASGLVPPGVPGTEDEDFRTAGGELVDCNPEEYAADCGEAARLLENAGYTAGYRFPAVELLYPEGENRQAVASAMADMWARTLNAAVTPRAVSRTELAAALSAGNYTLALTDVGSLVNDAEGFLTLWASDDSRNAAGYINSAYDTLLAIIGKANDETARRGCLHDAEQLLLEECPLTPLFFTGMDNRLRETWTGVCRDARGFYSFSTAARLH